MNFMPEPAPESVDNMTLEQYPSAPLSTDPANGLRNGSTHGSTLGFSASLERGPLLKLLTHVQHVVERRNTIAILSNLLMEARDQSLQLTATDMDILVTESVGATVHVTGAITVSAHTLCDIVRKLPEDAVVTFEYASDTQMLHVRAGASHFVLSTLPADHFPIMARDEFPGHFTLSSPALCHLLDKTRYAISNEETRYYLNGIYLHTTLPSPASESGEAEGFELIAVATDGHRLARATVTAPESMPKIEGIILPKKMVVELRKLLTPDATEPVRIAFSQTKIEFTMQSLRLLSKLVDATFPDYRSVIPKEAGSELALHRNHFVQMVDRIAIIADEKNHGIRLKLEHNSMTLSAAGVVHGSGVETIPVHYAGEPIEFAFNAHYLLEALGAMRGEKIYCIFRGPNAAMTLLDAEDASITYIIMPMRL